MKRLVVIGGGISGLSAAWAAARAAEGEVEVMVLEREHTVGGKAQSFASNGWLAEGGPGGFIAGKPAMDEMIRACGMESERVTASAASANRFIYREGRLRRVAGNPIGLARSGLLTAGGLLRLAAEPLVRQGSSEHETVWEFAERRIGREAAERLIAPMTQGVFAGDPARLSLAAAFPKMAALEREHGSLVRGLIAKRGRMSSGALTSFRGGLQSLPLALSQRGGFAVKTGVAARSIQRDGNGWSVSVDGDWLAADAVLLACEPWVSAGLLRGAAPDAVADLAGIYAPPVSVVSLGFGTDDARRVPDGFGVLIARQQGLRALGNLWDSRIFPGRSPEGHLLMRFMFGGAVDPDAGSLNEDELLVLARTEVARLYGVTAAPVFSRVVRVPRAIPQYELGHLDRVARIERAVRAHRGLFITGFGLRGVAFADAATNGITAGQQAMQWLTGAARTTPAERSTPAPLPLPA